jgi:pimeloyl-ACP methyl ester carboxylesterase
LISQNFKTLKTVMTTLIKTLIKSLLVLVIFISACVCAKPNIADLTDGETDVVYLLHGLGRSSFAMRVLASRLEDAGFIVYNIGYPSINKTPEEILENISQQISASLPKTDQNIHFVGHSLGGLLIRAYLEKTNIKNLGNVVLMGTPNKGTTLVDNYRDSWWMQMLGPAALALSTDENSFPNSIGRPYYPVGIIAGIYGDNDNEDILPGDDDGVVPLESTKIDGMTDFIVIESSHYMMRYNRDVADQTIMFLRHSRFKKDQ